MPEEKRPFRTPKTGQLWEKLKPLARQKRHEPTQAEDRLWQQVRRDQLGAHFRRQHAIERFIVDFFCASAHLVIEVDGAIHDYTPEEDAIRQKYLESLGLCVIRFTNDQVFDELDKVIESIRQALNNS
jgi:very-short-patch-repair endonuclease